ncbi:MAG TPA: Ref family recombination enhancement nuclease, partial [Steroidobacteraceae bacterium]|nr:Ref family recombination enhancement nuclease [Steroidobacteraceae bacterium]
MIWHKNYVWPTAAEREREKAARKLGCVLSRLRIARGLPVPGKGPVHIHHLVKPGKRYGHGYSIPLHGWYHEAIVPYPYTSKDEAREA